MVTSEITLSSVCYNLPGEEPFQLAVIREQGKATANLVKIYAESESAGRMVVVSRWLSFFDAANAAVRDWQDPDFENLLFGVREMSYVTR